MKSFNYIILLTICILFFISCSGKKDKGYNTNNNKQNTEKVSKNNYLFDDTTQLFYTVDPKLEDIESEIALLKEQIIQYESQISAPNFNTEILKLMKNPTIKHEIQLSNGTVIQGVIIYENVDQLIVETQIGQLQINKNEVIQTQDVMPPIARLEFIGDAIEEIYDGYRIYKGNIKNNGLKRADFARVIYSMHDENSNVIVTDSAFISGNKKIFNSGIISDASINPNEFADFYIKIETPDNQDIKYFIRDIRWEYFE